MCMKSLMLGNADGEKNSLVEWCVWPVLQSSLTLSLDLLVWVFLLAKMVGLGILGWKGVLPSLYPPRQFLWTWIKNLCLGITDPKLALLNLKVFLFRIGLWCHLGLDGSFILTRHGCERRLQRLAIICIYVNDYPITLLFKYCLILQAAESWSGAEHDVSKKMQTWVRFLGVSDWGHNEKMLPRLFQDT